MNQEDMDEFVRKTAKYSFLIVFTAFVILMTVLTITN